MLLYPSPKSTRETPIVTTLSTILVLLSNCWFFFHMPYHMSIIFYSALFPLSKFLIFNHSLQFCLSRSSFDGFSFTCHRFIIIRCCLTPESNGPLFCFSADIKFIAVADYRRCAPLPCYNDVPIVVNLSYC